MARMTRVPLDDGFYEHPKAHAAGPLGRDMFLASLCYARRNQTDGFIPLTEISRLTTGINRPGRIAKRLVRIGLWEQSDGGYVIHDYAAHQPTRAISDSERQRNRVRQRRHRLRTGGLSRVSHAVSHTDQGLRGKSVSDGSADLISRPDNSQNPKDDFPIEQLLGEIRDADGRTAKALETLRHELPPAAFHGMREKLLERRERHDLPPIRSEARYVVRSLATEAHERTSANPSGS